MAGITRFTNTQKSLFAKAVAAVVTVLLAASFLNLATLSSAALADETQAGQPEAIEQPTMEAPEDPEVGANVFVYLKLEGKALEAANASGLGVNKDGWFTVGVIALDGLEKANLLAQGACEDVALYQDGIAAALKNIAYYPGAEILSLSAAEWTTLKVDSGASSYDVKGNAWHLDGALSDQLVSFEIRYIDADGNALEVGDVDVEGGKMGTRTILAALGSQMAAADQVVDIEGYVYSESLTEKQNGGLSVEVTGAPIARSAAAGMTLVYEKVAASPNPTPDDEGNGDDPMVVPDVPGNGEQGEGPGVGEAGEGGAAKPTPPSGSKPSAPNVNFTMPKNPQRSQGSAQGNAAATAPRDGFAAGERTTVSPSKVSEAIPESRALVAEPMMAAAAEPFVVGEVAIADDATPMVARSSAVIPEEEVPLGAFDAPVDPAPWVAGLGAIGTALWGVVAVRRRLVMAQKLAAFEGQVLGNVAPEADASVAPNAQQTF
ncbi:hypothetical protein VJ923_02760 [Adlercreutzia sp. R25]|uniref:Uncharacterized protein n=1 Tax=Adlercreutzia shanghongiae TaxID=3111773 RepID=A0ABU6IVF4_9ACTN|nr:MULTISPECIES: hypothetical protein [unclassified Adlercreutzia]MEC4272080.1 hypothetical protein [Adlercreutzia sp. R25]MEC4293811.1 hypothetical protein [Adlercreutzia sp. R22]